MKMTFTVDFHYYNEDGKDITEELSELEEWMKPHVEQIYVSLRNIYVDALNPHYDEWNKEFDEKYPEKVDDYSNDETYNRFICEKQDAIIKAMRNPTGGALKFHSYGKDYSVPDCTDLCADVSDEIFDEKVTMRAFLIPV